MAMHNDMGAAGENLAANWLTEKGYQVIHRNWRHSYFEIDIIATRNGRLHIIEVKTRNAYPLARPEESVSRKKFKRLQRAAHEYLFLHPGHNWIQYDILAITLQKKRPPTFFFLEDVFL